MVMGGRLAGASVVTLGDGDGDVVAGAGAAVLVSFTETVSP
jgi:hypothetical protein